MHLVEVDPLPTLGPLSPAQKLRKLGRNLLPPRLRSTNGINENSQIPS